MLLKQCALIRAGNRKVTSQTRSYTQLVRYNTFEERYSYLRLRASVGASTFGFDRWVNQMFYRSAEWRQVRNHVIARDNGCDLGCDGYVIYDRVLIHHMNPMTIDDIEAGDPAIIDPEYLISVTHRTHNAIHYGDHNQLAKPPVVRRAGDTKLW